MKKFIQRLIIKFYKDFYTCIVWEKDYKENKDFWIEYILMHAHYLYLHTCGIKILEGVFK